MIPLPGRHADGIQGKKRHTMKTIINARVLAIFFAMTCTFTQGFSRTGFSGQSTDSTPAVPFTMTVVMVEFDVRSGASGNQLKWSTILEANLSHYEIERSTSGQPFKKIGTVKAIGTGSLSVAYDFTDKIPTQGTNIYRIRMVDTRGGARFSEHKIANGNTQALVSQASRAFPNPARRGTGVRVTVPESGAYELRLISLQGRVVLSASMDNTDGAGLNVELPQGLPAGIYVLDAVSAESQRRFQHRILVQ